MEAENGVMQPLAKEGLEPPVEEANKDAPHRAFGGNTDQLTS